ncbi:MAG TPA: NAD-dependent epimerase/dehydratase family protein [Moheibacter sp.]|nr:NAD-dependent epimerase/dehydratase family protein [Moheibacter sp.]
MVLVTGATGLIGSYLLLELSKRGKSIRAMKRRNSNLEAVRNLFLEFSDESEFSKIEWVEADLLEITSLESALQGIETIFHTAASVGFDDRSKKMIQETNVKGTENLVNLAISNQVPNFVYISSIAVLDELPGEKTIDENSKWDTERIHSEYAISKKKGEMNVWRGSEEGLNVLVVHPSIVIGSLDGNRASEKLFKLASRKKMFATKGLTGYVDVRDLAFSLTELTERKLWNNKFIISAENMRFDEVFSHLRKNKNLPQVKILSEGKLKLAKTLSQISRIFGGPYMSEASYQALTGKLKYSNEKIKNEIGIEFVPVEKALDFHAKRFDKLTTENNSSK